MTGKDLIGCALRTDIATDVGSAYAENQDESAEG